MNSKRDQNREKILSAAFNEMYRCGYQAASIANILNDTGLTKGALYHHFPTKQDLGIAVVDERIAQMIEDYLLKHIEQSDTPLQAFIDHLANSKDISPEAVKLGCPLNNMIQEMSPLDERFKTHLQKIMLRWQHVIENMLTKSQQNGELRQDIDTKATAIFIFAAFEGCVGLAKNNQSIDLLDGCMNELRTYVLSLKA